ncbi:MAG: ATP-binding protein [Bdellovibrionota bacterium]
MEIDSLKAKVIDLELRLFASTMGGQADRESRRAALNLMEDAMEARRLGQLENERRQRVEAELREADRRKDEFLATLAHELRNPLAPIRNGLHLLRLACRPEEQERQICSMLERQITHLVRLVDDLMEVSRITRGKIELRKEFIELRSIIRTAIDASKPTLDAYGQELVVELPNHQLMLHADSVRMVQVVTNLLNNAAKYTDGTGEIRLSCETDGNELVLSIADTGIGIPPSMLSQVFDLFTQVDQRTNRTKDGLGIGLTLVRTLVELHGGTVEARSEGLGRGTEFIIRLPLAHPVAPEHRQEKDLASDMARHRILVVDDNRDAADSLGTLLELLGAKVTVTHDGPSALALLDSFRPTVLLLDIGMPDMDGNEVARRSRKQAPDQQFTLIALTGWGQEADRRRSKEAGFDYHLVKPVQLDELQELLASLPRESSVPATERDSSPREQNPIENMSPVGQPE